MEPIIEISNIYKEYQLGIIGRDTFYRDFQSFIAKLFKREDPNTLLNSNISKNISNKFLALKDINLKIYKGDVIGIIGRNGAGKSTLLKILSRITSPSKGSIKFRGRMASLLEVGTGFHGELTGRENIYLNGAINGMKVHEVDKEIDNIIKFSGILVEHIDTPVKRYSSGMIVKLGFSVAAHLNYDILVCDEVLAVGDQEFQNKAINKVKEINSDAKKTVIFVSHNMDSILKICNKVAIMNEGRIEFQGKADDMVMKYLNSKNLYKNYFEKIWNENIAPQSNSIKLLSISTKNYENKLTKEFDLSEKIYVEIKYKVLKDNSSFCTNLFFSKNNQTIFQTFDDTISSEWSTPEIKKIGVYKQVCEVPENIFDCGEIDINIVIFCPPGDVESTYHIMEPKRATGIISFKIIEKNKNKSRGSYPFSWIENSLSRTVCTWSTKFEK
jgi:lipopolysaccharide transport system ATP-binding protein